MATRAARPNILAIVVHDIGTFLGCCGHPWLRTPHLDRLAADGVRLTEHFCTAPFCSPSRSSLWTSTYPHVNGLMGLVNLGWDLPPRCPVLAQVLGRAGYETFLFGFQHEARDVSRLGFEHVCRPGRSAGENVAPMVADFLAGRGNGKGAPFYARVGFSDCHRPWPAGGGARQVEVPAFLADTPGVREDLARFGRALHRMDLAVGRILDALDSAGLRDGTLVVFTTDHGAPFPGAKGTLYDTGLRTAMILRWPGGFAGGAVTDALLSNVDLFPTLLEAAGVETPRGIQGRSFLPLLCGRACRPREWVFAELNTLPGVIRRCVRSRRHKYIENGTPSPQLVLPTDVESSLSRRDMGNGHLRPCPPGELYDLRADPNETHNRIEEPGLQDVRQRMASLLRQVQQETHDPALAGAIARPPQEAGILKRALAASLAGCEYPRAGLQVAMEVVFERATEH